MKKTILTIVAMLLCALSFSQVKYDVQWDDINTIQTKKLDEIIARFGKPEKQEKLEDMDNGVFLKYSNLQISIDISDNICFYTEFILTNSNFCVLSTVISGGLRVGDNISKAKQCPDITKCKKPVTINLDLDGTTDKTAEFQYMCQDDQIYYYFSADDDGVIKAIYFLNRI